MALASGTRLGPYEVLAPIGAGGMGEVYRARDTRLHRDVAVKVLPAAVADDARALARFEREARALAAVSHPAILVLHDIGREGGVAFAVTELLEGETFRALLRDGALPWREAVRLAAEAADGLAAAHARGIVHRDLKPENLFLCSDGRVKVLDFGLAKAETVSTEATTASADALETSPGALVGTIGYMSPEQLRGLPVDHRADLFALGCVLHELLAGRRAFPGRTASEVVAAILHEEPSAEAADPAVPGAVREVAVRCLRKNPSDRYSSAHDVALSLRAILSGSAPAVSLDPPRRGGRSRILLAAFVTIGAAGFAAWLLLRSHDGLPPLQPRPLTSGAGCESEPALSPDGGTVAFVAEAGGARRLHVVGVEGGRPLALTEGGADESSPAWLPDGSALLYAFEERSTFGIRKVGRLGGPPQTLLLNARDPAVSPDGLLVAFSRPDARGFALVHVAPLASPEEARAVSRAGEGLFEHRQPRFSPDGRTLCFRDFHDLWLVPVAGGPARRLTHDQANDYSPSFSPDGAHVYFDSFRASTQAIWRVDVAGGAPERVTLGTGQEKSPSLSRDGRRLAYATWAEGGALVLVDRRSGTRDRLEESRVFGTVSLDPLGRFVVFSASRETTFDLWRQEVSGGRFAGAATRLTDAAGSASCPSVSPDGRWVAYHVVRDAERDIRVVAASGGAPVAVAPSPAADYLPSWSPDGATLLFTSLRSGREEAWGVAMKDGRPAGEPRRLAPQVPFPHAFPRFLPDGRSLVVLSGETGRGDVWVLPPGGSPPRRLTADGRSWFALPDPSSGELVVIGRGAGGFRELRSLPLDGGEPRPVPWARPGSAAADLFSFDVSADGALALLVEELHRGDVWLLEAGKGRKF